MQSGEHQGDARVTDAIVPPCETDAEFSDRVRGALGAAPFEEIHRRALEMIGSAAHYRDLLAARAIPASARATFEDTATAFELLGTLALAVVSQQLLARDVAVVQGASHVHWTAQPCFGHDHDRTLIQALLNVPCPGDPTHAADAAEAEVLQGFRERRARGH